MCNFNCIHQGLLEPSCYKTTCMRSMSAPLWTVIRDNVFLENTPLYDTKENNYWSPHETNLPGSIVSYISCFEIIPKLDVKVSSWLVSDWAHDDPALTILDTVWTVCLVLQVCAWDVCCPVWGYFKETIHGQHCSGEDGQERLSLHTNRMDIWIFFNTSN